MRISGISSIICGPLRNSYDKGVACNALKNYLSMMKITRFLFSPVFMGILLIVFAMAMGIATFIENDFGPAASRSFVYETKWFEFILLILAVNLIGRLVTHKLFRRSKLPVAIFHLSFLLMIIGAAITRYIGWEGTIHIREGESVNTCYSNDQYIGYSVTDNSGTIIDEYSGKYSYTGRFRKKIMNGDKEYYLTLSEVVPDAVESDTENALVFSLNSGDKVEPIILWDRQSEYLSEASCIMDNLEFKITFGSQVTKLPFSLRLNDFILERYPGSESPSGYKSDVTVIDRAAENEWPFVIFMNNVLKHRGFRFYQSSFDQDEKGTILSVSHDPAGIIVTYTGYALLFLFIILSLIIKSSSFRTTRAGSWDSFLRKGLVSIFILLISSLFTGMYGQKMVPGKKSADEFGKILVQDQKGRTKPLYSLSSDIIRKVSRENKFEGYTSMQVFLGLYFDFDHWKDVKLIRVSNKDLQKRIKINSNMVSFADLVDLAGRGGYRISEEVDNAYSKPPGKRDRIDKEIMKVDERVNIIYMIYRGNFLKIFPLKDETQNWGSPEESLAYAISREDSLYLNNIMPFFAEALNNDDLTTARKLSESVKDYQIRFSSYQLPSDYKVKAEILYYKLGIFERLFPFYATIGSVMLILLIISVIRERGEILGIVKIFGWILFAGFLLHTFGLGLRWYISGHSPMSNGYESMIFISWVTLLAGFIFSRKSAFTLSATSVLAGMTLMVAHLSFMDPEITNLVPVLQSYWLTLHVSVITGSYGFLGLGAILGLINLVLISLTGKNSHQRISNTVDELTVINYRTLILGLYFLTIGTFLGAIWANESWGRYWGWDPKETWSLITIIVYTFVTHSRFIPGMKDIYTFNLISLFAFSSVLMTYFGVNYYLSGLHSYAGGDSLPVPAFVYVSVILLVGLSLFANIKYRRLRLN